MKPKTFLYILVAIAIIAIAAFVVYQFIHRETGPIQTGTGQTGALPTTANQHFSPTSTVSAFNTNGLNASSSKFGIISNDPALNYSVDTANTVTLLRPNGVVESITNNKTNVISSSTISNIISSAFSYDGKKMLVTYRAGTSTQSSVLDLGTRAWSHLPNGIQSPVWSPINYQVVYFVPSPNSGSETLMTIDAGTVSAKPTTITSFNMVDMLLQWPSANTLVISDRPSAFTTGSIWLFNISSQTLSSAVYESFGGESLWNPSGSALIFSGGPSNAGGQLSFLNTTGEKTLSFATLPSKCAFGYPVAASGTVASAPIYCGVPRDQSTLSVARLPDEYDQGVYFTDDDFYRINTDTGLLSKIFSSLSVNQTIDAARVKIFNNILFFVNRYDQKVYALSL